MLNMLKIYIQYIQGLCQSRLSTANFAQLSLLYVLCRASPCPVLRTFSLSWFCMILVLFKVKVKVTLRLTVSQSVSLGVEPHLGLMTRYLTITIWQLRSCFCGAPFLTRGRACLLYMLLGLPNAVFLGSESLGTQIWGFHFRRLLRLAGSR
jgi:hypothetical protein